MDGHSSVLACGTRTKRPTMGRQHHNKDIVVVQQTVDFLLPDRLEHLEAQT
ncbi:hypothetical protein JNB11_08480 [Kocuria palustris]|nr:hypothetical protein [Kocuria palustris]